MNLFWKLWVEATKNKAEGAGSKFVPFEVHWSQIPGRDDAWREQEIANLGSLEAFSQEYECVAGDTLIKVRNKDTDEILEIQIQEFYKYLEKDSLVDEILHILNNS